MGNKSVVGTKPCRKFQVFIVHIDSMRDSMRDNKHSLVSIYIKSKAILYFSWCSNKLTYSGLMTYLSTYRYSW